MKSKKPSCAPVGSLTSEQIDALWSINDPAKGEASLRMVMAEYPASADELRTQVARSLGLQGRFDEAWREIGRISKNASEIVQVRVHLESGRLKSSSGNREGSQAFFRKALVLAEEQRFDFYAIDAAHMMAIVSEGEESLEWNEKALRLAANSKDKRAQKWKGSLLNNLGWKHFDMGEFHKALSTFESALAFQKTSDNPIQIRMHSGLWADASGL